MDSAEFCYFGNCDVVDALCCVYLVLCAIALWLRPTLEFVEESVVHRFPQTSHLWGIRTLLQYPHQRCSQHWRVRSTQGPPAEPRNTEHNCVRYHRKNIIPLEHGPINPKQKHRQVCPHSGQPFSWMSPEKPCVLWDGNVSCRVSWVISGRSVDSDKNRFLRDLAHAAHAVVQ